MSPNSVMVDDNIFENQKYYVNGKDLKNTENVHTLAYNVSKEQNSKAVKVTQLVCVWW